MSLRTRLLLVLAALAAAGLAAAAAATYLSERSFLIARVDRTVAGSGRALAEQISRRGSLDPTDLDQLASTAPGVYLGVINRGGTVRWSPIGLRPDETPPPEPRLPARLRLPSRGHGSTLGLGAVRGGARFRARLEALFNGETLVVAAPLGEVDANLHHLLLIEALVALAVVAGVVGLGLWLVRLGLRPLGRIEQTAGAIAAGDLTRRIEIADERTEVGRLGSALNAMLGQIEQAFAERTTSERRLRRFVGDASHELRTPLAAVQAYAELFDRGARDRPEDLARSMAGIEREAKRMGVLVDDLLLLARLDQGRPLERQPVDLSDVAGEAIEAAHILEPERPLELLAAQPVHVLGDAERLRRVIDNLLANVRAHTPPGAPARVRVASNGSEAIVEVIDEGSGLDDEAAAHVFERFFRGDPSRSRDAGGAGLGLSLVTAIAAAHGGSVEVGRADGTGAIFRVSLPLARPAAAGPDAGAPRS